MRPPISILLVITLFVLCSTTNKTYKLKNSDNVCEFINSTRQLTKLKFVANDHNKINLKGLSKLNEEYHNFFYNNGLTSSEKNYLYGQFKISNTRIGLICFNKTIECDHDQYFFTLHIVDNCKKAKEFLTLSLSDSDGGILYEISSSINKTFDTLTIKKETTSEWVVGTNSKIDTLFTDIYKLNLKSINLDTVSKKSFYKKIKYD